MKKDSQYSVVFVTAPNIKIARSLAKAALEARLVACANLVPAIESHYWWQGKIEKSREVLLMMKTVQGKLVDLEKLIVSLHPYETPEFVVMTIGGGNEKYLAWIGDTVAVPGM